MSKISFPQHMRNAQAALVALVSECERYDPGENYRVIISMDGDGCFFVLAYGISEEGETFEEKRDTLEDAATKLLHAIAGTEMPPF